MRRARGPGAGLIVVLGTAMSVGCGHTAAPESSMRDDRRAGELAPVGAAEPPTDPLLQPAPSAAPEAAMAVAARQQAAPPPPSLAPRGSCEARLGADGLRRGAVNRTLDAGLGHWLRGVDVDPKVERGRFRGWIVRTLPEDVCYVGLDLQAGDVVTRINGRRVERPEEAKDIWDGLRTSPALVIDFLRDGRPRTLRFDIIDR